MSTMVAKTPTRTQQVIILVAGCSLRGKSVISRCSLYRGLDFGNSWHYRNSSRRFIDLSERLMAFAGVCSGVSRLVNKNTDCARTISKDSGGAMTHRRIHLKTFANVILMDLLIEIKIRDLDSMDGLKERARKCV